MYSSMALKSGGSVHTWTPTLPESEGVRTAVPPQDRHHWTGHIMIINFSNAGHTADWGGDMTARCTADEIVRTMPGGAVGSSVMR